MDLQIRFTFEKKAVRVKYQIWDTKVLQDSLEGLMRKRTAVAFAVATLLPGFFPRRVHLLAAEKDHLQQITVNWEELHDWPKAPVVVVLIDGGDPTYVNAGLAQGLLPNFKKFMTEGFVSVALGAMPAYTNPNNVSVITGVPPSVHRGISGNFFLESDWTGPGNDDGISRKIPASR